MQRTEMEERERERMQAQAVARQWPEQLLDLSVRYLALLDRQREIAGRWDPDMPSEAIMHEVMHLRSACVATALHCLQLRSLATHLLDDPPDRLLQLSALLERGFFALGMWAPGDRFDNILPGIDELSELTRSDDMPQTVGE
jgi:hypothetical protein